MVFVCACLLPQGVGRGLHVYLSPPPGCWAWSSCVPVSSPRVLGVVFVCACLLPRVLGVVFMCICLLPQGVGCGLHVHLSPPPGCWVWSSCASVPSPRVLGVVVDIEILLGLTKTCRDDTEAKLYAYLMQFLQKNLLRAKLPPLVGDGLTPPPFEKPSIKEVRVEFMCNDVRL